MVSCVNLKEAKIDRMLLFMIVASINLFQFSGLDLKVYQYIHLIVFTIIICVSIFKKNTNYSTYSNNQILLMVILPLLSLYSCNVINHQSYALSLIVYRMHLGWLIYFYLLHKETPINSILKTILVVGMLYMSITLIQQITYPFAPFGARTIGTKYSEHFNGGVERRMGFYRFDVGGLYYSVLSFFIILNNKIKNKIFLLLFFFLSIIASGNRQTLFSVSVAILYYYLYNNDIKHKFLILCIALLVSTIVYSYSDLIFGRLANVDNDLESGRMPSYLFYYEKITKSSLVFMFGNGLPNSASIYGKTIDMFGDFMVTPSDIGIIGTMYYWGAIYVIAYIFFVIKWLFTKKLSIVYKSILISFLLASPIASFLWEIDGFMLQGMLFYLCRENVLYNKNALV
jgi:hypothetical protein